VLGNLCGRSAGDVGADPEVIVADADQVGLLLLDLLRRRVGEVIFVPALAGSRRRI